MARYRRTADSCPGEHGPWETTAPARSDPCSLRCVVVLVANPSGWAVWWFAIARFRSPGDTATSRSTGRSSSAHPVLEGIVERAGLRSSAPAVNRRGHRTVSRCFDAGRCVCGSSRFTRRGFGRRALRRTASVQASAGARAAGVCEGFVPSAHPCRWSCRRATTNGELLCAARRESRAPHPFARTSRPTPSRLRSHVQRDSRHRRRRVLFGGAAESRVVRLRRGARSLVFGPRRGAEDMHDGPREAASWHRRRVAAMRHRCGRPDSIAYVRQLVVPVHRVGSGRTSPGFGRAAAGPRQSLQRLRPAAREAPSQPKESGPRSADAGCWCVFGCAGGPWRSPSGRPHLAARGPRPLFGGGATTTVGRSGTSAASGWSDGDIRLVRGGSEASFGWWKVRRVAARQRSFGSGPRVRRVLDSQRTVSTPVLHHPGVRLGGGGCGHPPPEVGSHRRSTGSGRQVEDLRVRGHPRSLRAKRLLRGCNAVMYGSSVRAGLDEALFATAPARETVARDPFSVGLRVGVGAHTGRSRNPGTSCVRCRRGSEIATGPPRSVEPSGFVLRGTPNR